MSATTTIRPATVNDLRLILEIYNEAIINSTAVYQETPHTLEMRLHWFNDKLHNNLPILVADVDHKFAGFATYGPFRNWPGYRYTVEHSVYVVNNMQGKGIGKKLVMALMDHARTAGMHVMIAGIDSAGLASIALHQSLGFTEVAHFKQVGFKFNQWLDLKFMQLIL